MRILITGATGLIGQQIVKECLKNKIDVNYLTTDREHIEHKTDYKGFYWDAKNKQIDVACLEGVEAIIHLAGASVSKRWTDSHKEAIMASRINTAQLLYDTLKNNMHQVGQFISASAIGAYPASKTKLYHEDFKKYSTEFLGQVVKAWEEEADRFEDLNLRVCKIRIGIVLAKKGGALPQLLKPIKSYLGAPLGSGEQWQSWVHIKDLAAIFRYALSNQLTGTYNAVAPNPVTNKVLTKKVAEVIDKPIWLPHVPPFALKLLMGEMASMVLNGQRVSSDKILGEGYQFKFAHLEPALRDLLK